MTERARENPAEGLAIGFRVKSGYAVAVVLAGPAAAPQPLARAVIDLSDPKVAGTRQPYHDGFYQSEQDERAIARRVSVVKRCAVRSVAALVGEVRSIAPSGKGRARSIRAGLAVGSLIDPATVGNPHIRAHANEGRLFRTVLEDALRAHGIDSDVIVEKQMAERAATELARSPASIARAIKGFGNALEGPWRADEKAAATAAWLALTRPAP